jgi:hypothetical protein
MAAERDISGMVGIILKPTFMAMYDAYMACPTCNEIHINQTTKTGDFVTRTKFASLLKIWIAWRDTHNGFRPNYISINKSSPPVIKEGAIQTAVEKTLGKHFTTIRQFYDLCKGRGYSYYYNDVKTLKNEELLRNLNCADATQLLVQLAKEMGYTARFVHVMCKSGGHIYAQLKGKELGTNWINVDLAACLSVGSQYAFGKVWCSYAKPVSYNDPWLQSDDGA